MNETPPRSSVWESLAVAALLVYFTARVIFFALKFDHSIPPDEVTHFDRVQLYAQHWGLPADSPDTASMGLIRHTPWLYYYLLGRILHLNVTGMDDLLLLRFASGVFGVATVLVAWRWMRRVTRNPWVRILCVVFLTNTLMFTAICAAVSYDSLVNLLAAVSVYWFTRYVLHPAPSALVWFLLALGLGALTKVTFLPLAAVLFVCLGFHERKRLLRFPGAVRTALRQARWPQHIAIAALAVVAAANIGLYGGNLVRYRALEPAVEQVLTQDQIMQSPVFARNHIITAFRSGDLTFDDARSQAEAISLEAVRRDTVNLLNVAELRRRTGQEVRHHNRLAYAVPWFKLMGERTFGLLGHEVMLKEGWSLVPYFVILLAAFAMFAAQWRPRSEQALDDYLAAAVLIYALVLMQVTNYSAYRNTDEIIVSLQGRYLFPVLVPLYGLTARYLLEFWPKPAQIALFVVASAVFIHGDFPFFLDRVEPVIFYR